MKEIIDVVSNGKVMSLIVCGIKYGDDYYVMYSVKRDKDMDNIFVSKIFLSSSGYVMDNSFSGGEKEVIDGVINDILNKDSEEILYDKRVEIIKNIKLSGINKFDVNKCYVTTISRMRVRDVMLYYGLISMDSKKVVVEEEELPMFSKGSVSSIFLIVFGIGILIFGGIVIFNAFIG